MKTLLCVWLLLVSASLFSQDVEERGDNFLIENNKNINRLEVKTPFYQIGVKGCPEFNAAKFEGGVTEYKKILTKYMYEYLNSDLYKLNGDFSFLVTINQDGRVTEVEGSPKVPHSKIFFDDVEYIFRRIKTPWIPAKCFENPVTSKIKIDMKFSSMNVEEE